MYLELEHQNIFNLGVVGDGNHLTYKSLDNY